MARLSCGQMEGGDKQRGREAQEEGRAQRHGKGMECGECPAFSTKGHLLALCGEGGVLGTK